LSRILGVDLGSRRIGLALSDASGTLASPYAVLARTDDRALEHEAILAAARENDVDRIIVGLPRSLSGKVGPAERATLEEIEELRTAAAGVVEIEAYDERFTTVIAERSLVQAGMRRDARRKVVDKVAAAVMLQSYLEANP
jgi:putative Holliday junction resolvase